MAAQYSLGDMYYERERTEWYWRSLATLSASLILLGFLVFPLSFSTAGTGEKVQSTLSLVSVILLALGYSISVALWFRCRSWLFQFDTLFVPCLWSCILGALNVIIHLEVDPHGPTIWTPSSISALTLAACSSLVYGLLSIVIHRKISRARNNGRATALAAGARSSLEHTNLIESEDPQRQAFAQLLSRSAVSQHVNASSTYHIDIPDKARLGNRGGTESSIPRPTQSSTRYWGPPSASSSVSAAHVSNEANPFLSDDVSATAAALRQARERTLEHERQANAARASAALLSSDASRTDSAWSQGTVHGQELVDFDHYNTRQSSTSRDGITFRPHNRANRDAPAEELEARMADFRDLRVDSPSPPPSR